MFDRQAAVRSLFLLVYLFGKLLFGFILLFRTGIRKIRRLILLPLLFFSAVCEFLCLALGIITAGTRVLYFSLLTPAAAAGIRKPALLSAQKIQCAFRYTGCAEFVVIALAAWLIRFITTSGA